jgi:hypothetical protein
MPPTPTRRKLLAAVGTVTATGLAGCTAAERARLNPFAEPPISMTVVRATGDESETRCTLDADAVAEIPVLQNPLDELADAEDGERIHRGLSIQKGREISNMFTRQCDGEIGGIYRYEGAAYLIGLTYRDQADHQDHHEHLGNETDDSGADGTESDETETPTPTSN